MRKSLDAILRGAMALLLAGMVINVVWQVFTRFVLRSPSSFTEEAARYSMIWLGLLGAAYCAGRKSHLALDLLTMKLTGRPRQFLEVFIQTILLAFALGVLIGGGGRLVWISFQLGQTSAALGLKLGYVYLAAPVSGALIALYAWMDLGRALRGNARMNEALVLGLVFAVLLLAGVPIAFAIGTAAVAALLVSLPPAPAATVLAQRMATGIDSFALLAIPFFILSGNLMNRGGIARRLIALAKVAVGRLPGGLACVNVLANMFFGAISGSAVAAAAANGGVMTPLMRKEGYDGDYAAAVNISSATTGLLIPPSNIMVVYSLASGGVSIAALFIAGYVPGILLGLALMTVAAVIARQRGYPTAARVTAGEAVRIAFAAVPSLLLVGLVMGGIIAGWFTPTEASAIAVVYALGLSVLIYREVKWADLPRIFADSAETTAIVLVLVGASMGMSWVMASANIPQTVSAGLIALTENKYLLLLIITLMLLVVGTFMDMTPAVLIFTPILLPVVRKFGMDPIHFGLMMIFNLCIGLCTPPVGSVLFIGCSVGQTSISRVWRPLLPFYVAMVVVLLLITYFPGLSLWLPKRLGF